MKTLYATVILVLAIIIMQFAWNLHTVPFWQWLLGCTAWVVTCMVYDKAWPVTK